MSSNRQTLYIIIGSLLILCACGVLIMLGVFYLAPSIFTSLGEQPTPVVATVAPNPRPEASANSLGDPNALIHMVLYSDFQCPFCARFYEQTESQIVDNYIQTGKVYFTYRSAGNWVSRNIGAGKTESEDAAAAAYCAGDQNKFWEMHDALFANANGEDVGSFTDARLLQIAKQAGLDANQFSDCYDGGKYKDQVQKDMQDGLDAGMNGTPFFVLTFTSHGQLQTVTIEGAQPYEVFRQTFDSILREVDQTPQG